MFVILPKPVNCSIVTSSSVTIETVISLNNMKIKIPKSWSGWCIWGLCYCDTDIDSFNLLEYATYAKPILQVLIYQIYKLCCCLLIMIKVWNLPKT